MTTTDELILWFTESENASRERAATLRADSRGDDAVLELVRGNIYRMFGAMFQVAARRSANDTAETVPLFLSRAEPFPAQWETSLEKAETHGDAPTAAVEQLKLDVWAEIFARVDELRRVAL
ncbi:MAG: hypothetical protein LBN00_03235 [Oscillospiraceae bacterium]|jgi:hypothetical protein|nr:hypothetical protein [Oscillospiraceae bacterium]